MSNTADDDVKDESVDDSLEADLAELEAEYSNKYPEGHGGVEGVKIKQQRSAPEPVPLANTQLPSNKEMCVSKILTLQSMVPDYEQKSMTYYRRLPRSEVDAILADLLNRATKEYFAGGGDEEEEEWDEDDNDEDSPPRLTPKPFNAERGARILYSWHIMISQVVEGLSPKLRNTKLDSDLIGLTEDYMSQREELEDIFRDMIEHDEAFKRILEMLTPLTRYAFLTVSTAGLRLSNNRGSKNDKEPSA